VGAKPQCRTVTKRKLLRYFTTEMNCAIFDKVLRQTNILKKKIASVKKWRGN